MIRLACGILAVAVLACMAAVQPRDPVYIAWHVETPLYWSAELVDHGKVLIVTGFGTMEDDPMWWEMVEWAEQDSPPQTSELAICFNLCFSKCSQPPNCGVSNVKYTGGANPSCNCSCFACARSPPNKAAD